MTPAGSGVDAPWWALHHAFGPADDMAELLAALSKARGRKLRRRMSDFCDRVLHQGTIYSASPPAVRKLIPIAARARDTDRALFYEMLAEFAASARKAIQDGCAIECCAGGDPKHGSAILTALLEARDLFARDLASPHKVLRSNAGQLLCCSAGVSAEAAHLVRNRYEIENDPATRSGLLTALIRVRDRFTDWSSFLASAIDRESAPEIRFLLRHEQIRQSKTGADATTESDLISLFVAASASESGADCGSFFEALEWLGPERQLGSLLQALEACSNRDVVHAIARRLLRLVFQDSRSGWQSVTYSIVRDGSAAPAKDSFNSRSEMERSLVKAILKMIFFALLWKMFPFLLRRKLRQRTNARHKIEYWQVAGEYPGPPAPLTAEQQRTLRALADKAEVWVDETNLWSLFGLPDNAEDVRAFVGGRAPR